MLKRTRERLVDFSDFVLFGLLILLGFPFLMMALISHWMGLYSEYIEAIDKDPNHPWENILKIIGWFAVNAALVWLVLENYEISLKLKYHPD